MKFCHIYRIIWFCVQFIKFHYFPWLGNLFSLFSDFPVWPGTHLFGMLLIQSIQSIFPGQSTRKMTTKTRSYICIANIKKSPPSKIKSFITNVVTMGLYDRSAMAEILDMQINFQGNPSEGCVESNLRRLEEYWRLKSVWVNVIEGVRTKPRLGHFFSYLSLGYHRTKTNSVPCVYHNISWK